MPFVQDATVALAILGGVVPGGESSNQRQQMCKQQQHQTARSGLLPSVARVYLRHGM
jgi:hypothetical protein